MLLSIKHNFLFIHIAKTGGTSIRDTLNLFRWHDPLYLPQFVCSRISSLTGHRIGAKFPRHAKAIAAKEMLPHELFDSLFKFTVVRNPWDLQVSSYHHLKRERPHLLEGIESFDQFIRWKLNPQRPYQFHADISAEQQSDYLIDLHGNLIIDFIGHYESLHDDFEKICARLNLQNVELLHKRKAIDRKRDYREYYSDKLAEMIADHYQRDIELLGYRFDPPND